MQFIAFQARFYVFSVLVAFESSAVPLQFNFNIFSKSPSSIMKLLGFRCVRTLQLLILIRYRHSPFFLLLHKSMICCPCKVIFQFLSYAFLFRSFVWAVFQVVIPFIFSYFLLLLSRHLTCFVTISL